MYSPRRTVSETDHFKCSVPSRATAETLDLQPSLSRNTGAGVLEVIAGSSDKNHVPIFLDFEFVNNELLYE